MLKIRVFVFRRRKSEDVFCEKDWEILQLNSEMDLRVVESDSRLFPQ